MNVLYYNNCWFTNVGEAFIDIGAMCLIKKIFPGCQLINVSNMNRMYADLICKKEKQKNPYGRQDLKTFHMLDYFGKGGILVLTGMFVTDLFLNNKTCYEVRELKRRGMKIMFLGLGGQKYSEKELENFKRFIEDIRPILIMSRDNKIYENFKNDCSTVKGLDCAFWVKDVYDPRNASDKLYNIVAYNRSPEPDNISALDNAVRLHHMNWAVSTKDFKDNWFISDTPYDYLTLYANAHKVYTDLVHATIAALQYERYVKFERVDNRGLAIDALKNVQVDRNGFLYIKEEELELQKQTIVEEIIKEFVKYTV